MGLGLFADKYILCMLPIRNHCVFANNLQRICKHTQKKTNICTTIENADYSQLPTRHAALWIDKTRLYLYIYILTVPSRTEASTHSHTIDNGLPVCPTIGCLPQLCVIKGYISIHFPRIDVYLQFAAHSKGLR